MRRLALGLVIALALHVAMIASALRVRAVEVKKESRISLVVSPPMETPPVEEAATPARRTRARAPRSVHPTAPPAESNAAPVSEETGPTIDLRRPPSLSPSVETLLGALEPPPPRLTTAEGRPIVIVEDEWDAGRVADALSEALDGRKLAEGSADGPLLLRRKRDGTLQHDGKKLTAVIRDDGSVRFFEKLDVAVLPGPFAGNGRTAHQNAVGDPTLAEVLRKSSVNEVPPGSLPPLPLLSGTFDVNAPLQRLGGNDPLAQEKSCFLDDTRALRESLAQESRTLAEARALYALDQQLLAILAQASMDAAAKKRAIFDLWADCSPEHGDTARHRIESFVRTHMPRGSPLAFSDDELLELNALIDAGEPFAPYG